MARMTQKQKIKAALQYQEQGYEIEDILKFLNYKSIDSIKHLVCLFEGSFVKGKISIDPELLKEEKQTIVKRKCTKCGNTFKTKTDKTGFPLNTRCKPCKIAEKQANVQKYSDYFYRGRLL